MIPNYTTVRITANANENVVDKIYEELHKSGYTSIPFNLDFVGFEMTSGTHFKINGNPLKVPSTGIFYSPYASSSDFLSIHSLTFDTGVSNQDFWIIY